MQKLLACERRRISGCRGDKPQPEICLRSQAILKHGRYKLVPVPSFIAVKFCSFYAFFRSLISIVSSRSRNLENKFPRFK